MNKTPTIDYYNRSAGAFFESTRGVDFSEIQERFLWRVKPGGRILDLGCGSGRDSRAFLERGYEVVAVDGSEELAKLAGEFIGQEVIVADFREFEPEGTFDGIWACASLLHLPKEEIAAVMRKMADHLEEGGCFYASFKYGEFQGERNGRYFMDMTEESFQELLEEVPGLVAEEVFVTGDVRDGRNSEKWLNVMLKKVRER
jgi:SAM-dependent methyltransferase